MIDGYVYKQTALDALAKAMPLSATPDGSAEIDRDIHIADEAFSDSMQIIQDLPSADVIPVSWIEEQIKRLGEMDNTFASLAAANISSLLRMWRDEVKDERELKDGSID